MVCPWWLAYAFDNPLRRWLHPADKVLGPYVGEGMTVLDFGCGFGHFSLGMARLTGPSGLVVAADLQQKMLDKTMARARKGGLEDTIRPVLCDGRRLGDPGSLDFALAANVLHETREPGVVISEVFTLLREGGLFLILEPYAHLRRGTFESEVALARGAGFVEVERPRVAREMSVLLEKPGPGGTP